MNPKRSKRARRRRKLWEKDPRCHWCGRQTHLNEQRDPVAALARPRASASEAEVQRAVHRSLPPDTATIDHLWPKSDPRRQKGIPSPVVLACYRCNHDRGDKRV